MAMILKQGKQALYSIFWFDNNGEMQEGNFHALNIKDARRKSRKMFPAKDIIAVGLTIGVFEDEKGIHI
jgi:hypothetical protein